MYSLSEELVRATVRERRAQAAATRRAAQLTSARRWERRADIATYRARVARLALR